MFGIDSVPIVKRFEPRPEKSPPGLRERMKGLTEGFSGIGKSGITGGGD